MFCTVIRTGDGTSICPRAKLMASTVSFVMCSRKSFIEFESCKDNEVDTQRFTIRINAPISNSTECKVLD